MLNLLYNLLLICCRLSICCGFVVITVVTCTGCCTKTELGGVWVQARGFKKLYFGMSRETVDLQGGPKSDIILVSKFPLLLNALYLQFLFTRVSLSLNDVVVCPFVFQFMALY